MTNDQINEMYGDVEAHQRSVLADMAALAEDFAGRFLAIKGRLPGKAASSPVAQYLDRVQMSVANVFGYDLANLKVVHGLTDPAPVEPQPEPAADQQA